MRVNGKKNTLLNVLNRTIALFERAGIESAENQAQLMLAQVLDLRVIDLYLYKDTEIDTDRLKRIGQLSGLRCKGTPLQYLTGKSDFYGYEFFSERGVFIGRPETEILVEKIIALAASRFAGTFRILEIGVGSGNISVALTKNLPGCKILATDLNVKALNLARKNAERYGVEARIELCRGDIWPQLTEQSGVSEKFDIIVSNPPYITKKGMEDLPQEVKAEPAGALYGGPDGLDFYRRIISGCGVYLNSPGWIAFEFGDFQQPEMEKILRGSGNFREINFFADLNGIIRFVIAEFHHG